MKRTAELERKTKETQIRAKLNVDGSGQCDVDTGIGFFDHMLTLLATHGRFDLTVSAVGDLDVDAHHTVEDVGLVLGEILSQALGTRQGINRYGHAVVPMDDALAEAAVDLSNRPYLIFLHPDKLPPSNSFDAFLAKEFFRALSQKGGFNLHLKIAYGENWHHMIEAVFKAMARALRQATAVDSRMAGVPSSKGVL